MGTIENKLAALSNTKAAIKAAIIAKGGTATDVFSTYANSITALPSGSGTNDPD